MCVSVCVRVCTYECTYEPFRLGFVCVCVSTIKEQKLLVVFV